MSKKNILSHSLFLLGIATRVCRRRDVSSFGSAVCQWVEFGIREGEEGLSVTYTRPENKSDIRDEVVLKLAAARVRTSNWALRRVNGWRRRLKASRSAGAVVTVRDRDRDSFAH